MARYGAIVPHLKTKNGGLRRFVEVGNEFAYRSLDFTLYAPEPQRHPEWDIRCKVASTDRIDADYVLMGDPTLSVVAYPIKSRVWVWVIAEGRYQPLYDALYADGFPFLLANRKFQGRYPASTVLEGGIGPQWHPRHLRVGYSQKKSPEVERLNSLYHVQPVPLDGLSDMQLLAAYHSLDYFVSWEKHGGWGNMAAEALACGVAVVTNGINCEPFIDQCIKTDFWRYFSRPAAMQPARYSHVVDQLLDIWERSRSTSTSDTAPITGPNSPETPITAATC